MDGGAPFERSTIPDRHGAAVGRAIAWFAAASLIGALLVTVPAAEALEGAPTDDLDAAREQLDGASRELTELEASVRRTNDEVAALEVQLTAATTALAQVTDELARARAAATEAVDAERAAAGALAEADAALGSSLTDWHHHRDRMAERAVHAFKHGNATNQDVLVRGVAGANDFHEVAVTLEAVGRLAEQDRELVDDSVATTRDSARLRAEVAQLRTASIAAIRVAADEAARVEALVTRQQNVVGEVGETRDRRRAVLAELGSDAAARAVLVSDLERRVASLELDAVRVLVTAEVDLDPFGPPPAWASGLPGEGPTWASAIEAAAARHGLDGRLLAALVWTESNFRADAVSHAGALGLTQLMPGTARGLGVDPRDPLANLDGGARYLRSQLDAFGRVDLALAAYNAGPGRVQRANGIPDIVETQLYVVRVLDRYEQLGG
jgi:soluble lytic murein transglycosylase-like protein